MRRVTLLLGLLLVSPLCADDAEVVAKVRALVEARVAEPISAGISVAVARGDDLLLADGFGWADLENRVPATAETVYRIGSVTKQFTAAAILKLIEEGELGLEDDLSTHYPDFDTHGKRVTIHHLLSHTSGIKSYTDLGRAWKEKIRLDLSHDELLALVEDEEFEFEPGADWRYNNTGYYLLGVVLEEVTLEPYGDFLRERFFRPLGMTGTRYDSERDIIPHRARGYSYSLAGLVNCEYLSMNQPGAAGGLISTVTDLIRWQRGLASGAVISADSFARMKTPLVLPSGSPTHYGYGLEIGELHGVTRIGHGGGINGFVSQLAWYPDPDVTVVVLSNAMVPFVGRLERDIASVVLGLTDRADSPDRPEPVVASSPSAEEDGWITIFNGVDLDGWTPKIQGHELGEDPNHTFRVEDGVLRVAYDEYPSFDRDFGHLFHEHEHEYASYDLRLDYRFTGDQVPGGPGWAYRNSGIMVHGQAPDTMRVDQDFPVSIELQLLGGDGTHDRHTANLCTPGTNVVIGEQLVTTHCIDSNSATYHGDRWVTVEVQVRGGEVIRHLIGGEVVLEYHRPQLDVREADAAAWAERRGGELMLTRGSISLQAESHPCEFRNIRLRPIEE